MNINYEFKNKKLLDIALTHISLANEKNIESNQRLEFLGDSILSFVVAEYIYGEKTDFDEGLLTKIRAASVCEKSLSKAAEKMGLGNAVKFGKSESGTGANKPSILCDTYEAVLGAIYLDSDIETAKKWIMDNLKDTINSAGNMDFHDYKSELQSYYQKRDKGVEVVSYSLVEKKGPDHKPIFSVNAVYKGSVIGFGTGHSRKAAEQEAAKSAFCKIEGTKK